MENKVLEKIVKSKKYARVSQEFVLSVIKSLQPKYSKDKDLEEATKNLLHRVWGAYFQTLPKFKKILKKLEKMENLERAEYLNNFVKAHKSTAERSETYIDMYEWIYEECNPASIVDVGCGLNPLMVHSIGNFAGMNYKFFDIDKEEIDFLNKAFKLLNNPNFKGEVGDIFSSDFPNSDVVLLLKILPLVEQIEEGKSEDILNSFNSEYIVVSFPIRSLGGRNKGMERNYTEMFEKILDHFELVDKKVFNNELVYIIKKVG